LSLKTAAGDKYDGKNENSFKKSGLSRAQLKFL
jgi:hypothetical protein